MKSDQQKKYFNSPTKDLSKLQNFVQNFDEDSDFDINEKTRKIQNETEHVNDIKESINVSLTFTLLSKRKFLIK